MPIRPEKAKQLYPNMNKVLEKEANYYQALGRFVDAFATMETAMALTFWKFAGVSPHIARAVFSGVRAREAGEFCRRIMEAVGTSKKNFEDFKTITDQMGVLNTARNDIVHYGASAIGSEDAYVTNALKAHMEKKVNEFPVSPKILDQMRADAVKITFHLQYDYLGREMPSGALGQSAVARVLQSPWQYKRSPRPKRANHKQVAPDSPQLPQSRKAPRKSSPP